MGSKPVYILLGVCAVRNPRLFAAIQLETGNRFIVNAAKSTADFARGLMQARVRSDDIRPKNRYEGYSRGDRHSASQDLTVEH